MNGDVNNKLSIPLNPTDVICLVMLQSVNYHHRNERQQVLMCSYFPIRFISIELN